MNPSVQFTKPNNSKDFEGCFPFKYRYTSGKRGMMENSKNFTKACLFAFNGKEVDNETYGDGNEYDYGARIYNPRLARFLSVDPLTKTFPWYTPYQFAGEAPFHELEFCS